jgi:hypothetical protein
LSSILDCLAEGVVVYDSLGRIVLTSPAAERGIDPSLSRSETIEQRSQGYAVLTTDGAHGLETGETAAG